MSADHVTYCDNEICFCDEACRREAAREKENDDDERD